MEYSLKESMLEKFGEIIHKANEVESYTLIDSMMEFETVKNVLVLKRGIQ